MAKGKSKGLPFLFFNHKILSMAKKVKDALKHIEEIKDQKKRSFPKDEETIEEVVKKYIAFPHGTRNGWHPVYCEVCGDGARTKGPRGGWKFDGENAGYNCFNCGIHGAFTPEEEYPMSKDMKHILLSFGIPKKEYAKILFRIREGDPNFKPKEKAEQDNLIDNLTSKALEVPDYLHPLEGCVDTKTGKKSIELLESNCIDYRDYPFYISTGETKSKNPTDKANAKITFNRLVIPIYYKNHLLMLQARDLSGRSKNKYINIGSSSTTVFGLDRLNPKHEYIMVTESFWDAYHLQGVSVITNNISSFQIKLLNSINKPKIIVPDRMGDYNTLANRGVAAGWGVSIPKEFRNIKDVTDAIKKYGKLYALHTFMNSATLGDKAKLLIKNI